VDLAFENEDNAQLKPFIIMKINSVARVDQLLETAEENVNPFWVRELRFVYNSHNLGQDELEEYWDKVTQLMERCGHHVHGIKVDFNERGQTFEFEECLLRVLHATPILKSLEIVGGLYDDDERLDQLSDYFRAHMHQLPELLRWSS